MRNHRWSARESGDVTGVASTAKLDLVRSIGADDVIDHSAQDFLDGTTRYDLIVDIGGRNAIRRLRRALTPTGTIGDLCPMVANAWLEVVRA